MKSRRPPPAGPNADDPQLAADVHDALRSLGWVVPLCEPEALAAEDAAAEVELPESLSDPQAVLAGTWVTARTPAPPLPGDPGIDATLARAAREAGHLAPDVEQAMRRDRQAAERQREDDRQGPQT